MYKQYLLVLKKYREVSKGKFGVHCAHAVLAASLSTENERFIQWFKKCDQTKIVKVVNNETKLRTLLENAEKSGYPTGLVPDNGKSGEVLEGTVLMACIGPITEEEAKDLGLLKLSNLK